MKTTRFFLSIALIAFAVMAFSKPDDRSLSVKIKLTTALENRDLVKSMYQQLDISLLGNETPGYIIARVSHKHVTYYIYGRHEEWKSFFIMDLEDDEVGKKAPTNRVPKKLR
jgi:hypothetical protein